MFVLGGREWLEAAEEGWCATSRGVQMSDWEWGGMASANELVRMDDSEWAVNNERLWANGSQGTVDDEGAGTNDNQGTSKIDDYE